MKKLFFFIAFFFSFAQAVFAATIFTSDSSGALKTSFYTNETVYLAPSTANITTNSTSVRIYIMQDSNSWSNQTNLTDLSGGYKTFTTNDTGYLNKTNIIWPATLTVGNYDVIADANSNGVYDQGIDFIYDTAAIGFQVIPLLGPSLTVSVGENSTANHIYTIPSNNTDNAMLQLKISVGSFENIKLNSLSLIANGTGDDSKGISYVKLLLDANNNGIYDSTDNLLAGSKFIHDNGIVQLDIPNGYVIGTNTTSYFLIIYSMSNTSLDGDRYSFSVASVSAVGATSGTNAKASLSSVINSAIKTISVTAVTTTSTTTTISSITSSSVTGSSVTTSSVATTSSGNFLWFYIAAAVSGTVVIFFVVFYLRAKKPSPYQYEYKPPQ